MAIRNFSSIDLYFKKVGLMTTGSKSGRNESMQTTQLLAGRNALVTGGGSGIGAAIALMLAQHGANVAVTYLGSQQGAQEVTKQIETLGRTAFAQQMDATQVNSVNAGIQAIGAALSGSIDILVNNAGNLVKRCAIMDMDEALYDAIMDVNVKSTFLVTKAVLPFMNRGKGRIINMSSLAAQDGGGAGAAIYAASKGAVLTLTRGMAKEFAPRGITVNAVAPGFIANTNFHNTFTAPEVQQSIVSRIPIGRGGEAEDVAGAVLYLASDLAGFLTGEIIQINGGAMFI